MKLLLFVVFVFSLCSAGLGLVCVQCRNSTVAFCSGKVKNCTADELCMSSMTLTTAADGQKTFTFDRDCGDADLCNATGSITSFISYETQSTCCTTDACTPPQPTLPKRKQDLNQIQCPVCLAHSTGQCVLSNLRNCTGDEKFCGVYELKSDTERTIIMGCTTESFCRTSLSQKLLDGNIKQVMARCVRSNNGSDGLKAHVFHLLPVLLGTLLYIVSV